jgi:hypothetical protein
VLPALGSSGRELPADADLFGFGQAVTCLGPRDPAPDPTEVTVDTGSARLPGSLVIPPDAGGLMVFVRGSRANVFNVALLAARLTAITRWLRDQPGAAAVPVGYFGAGPGTAAALAVATATPRLPITAIVPRSGHPDLVGPTPSRPRPEGATFGPAQADQRPCRSGRPRTMLGA